MIYGLLTSFGLGFLYFVSAIPGGVAAQAPLWGAATSAWLGYSTGGIVVLVAGTPLREWIITKLKVSPHPDPTKLFWKIWFRFGLCGLGLIAPVTIGPQATAALALALGERPLKIQLAISLGILPWTILFAVMTGMSTHFLKH